MATTDFSRWLGVLNEGPARLADAFSLTGLSQSSTVWLAVTGLSRAGKTVFITSLIHNLLSAFHNPNRMPLLDVVGERRLLAARLDETHAGALPRFPYRENIEAMARGTPDWPDRTADISEIGVEVFYRPASMLGRFAGQIRGSASRLNIRIVDYPGEWLLDLPMLTQNYAEWSRGMVRLMRAGVRAQAAAPFLSFLDAHPAQQAASEDVAVQARDLYKRYLFTARDEHGLTLLQPGRFLCPGSLGDEIFMRFAPLDVSDANPVFARGTLGALMQERFDLYKREVVARFYEDHFRRYARQIVLVDVLRALLAGREAFEDTRLAIDAILRSFRYGRGNILSQLLSGAHIDRVLLAATKADHVPDVQRDHLAELLRNMAALPVLDMTARSADIDVAAIASVISTVDDTQEIDGQRVQVVVGRPLGQEKRVKFFVGNVPIRPPRAGAWDTPFLNVPAFEPPAIDPSPVDGIPHINLDVALEFLLGDRLR